MTDGAPGVDGQDGAHGPVLLPAERLKAFIDAAVAIALTLLVLPLMESVVAARERGETDAIAWVNEESGSLFLFAVSFGVIAVFWIIQFRLFARVHAVTPAVVWMLFLWLLTIVWFPISTAMTGAFDDDVFMKVLYMGTMVLTCLVTLVIRLYLRRHGELHNISPGRLRHGVAADVATAALFAFALVVAIVAPAVGYFALFLLVLTGPLERVLSRFRRR